MDAVTRLTLSTLPPLVAEYGNPGPVGVLGGGWNFQRKSRSKPDDRESFVQEKMNKDEPKTNAGKEVGLKVEGRLKKSKV